MRGADMLTALAVTSASAAVALYLAYGGAGDFTTVGGVVTSLGIVAGLIGTDLILIMLVLAARIPLIDRIFGHDRAMATHRSLGKPSIYLILAHAFLLIVGYGISSHINPIAETVSMWNLPDMPLAFVGTGLMLAVVVTSLVAVRRKFKYEFWYVHPPAQLRRSADGPAPPAERRRDARCWHRAAHLLDRPLCADARRDRRLPHHRAHREKRAARHPSHGRGVAGRRASPPFI